MRLNKRPEERLQIELCQYLKEYYPSVYFYSDPSGLRVTKGIRYLLQQTRSNHAHLDLVILEPLHGKCGLVLELKSETPFKINGDLKKDPHLEDQLSTMRHLDVKGFFCVWCWDYETGVAILNSYLGSPIVDHLNSIIDGSPYLK